MALRIAMSLLLLAPAAGRAAEPPAVAVSIPPLHGLVAAVMQGVGAPALLLRTGSPHGYVLRPSDARALAASRLVFLVDPRFESFLSKPLAALPAARVVTASTAPGIRLVAARRGGRWEPDAHDHSHDRDGERPHEAGPETDFHLWLAPANARAIVARAAAALSEADPANTARYAANAKALAARIEALETGLRARLAPLRDKPYIVFHDAYRYFEDAFALSPAGAVTVAPDRQPGIRRLQQIRAAIAQAGARCVFAEPQFEPALVHTIIDGTGARAGTLDPLGARIPPGPDAWFALMDGLAGSLESCLLPPG
ncbi:MAG: zinc ABC transporter substrate-binding protein [Alphaproteobacteria bacterium]|nr:zinc ABC transporter substrate-binding protein [Alphaproteobacteria bacterium]